MLAEQATQVARRRAARMFPMWIPNWLGLEMYKGDTIVVTVRLFGRQVLRAEFEVVA